MSCTKIHMVQHFISMKEIEIEICQPSSCLAFLSGQWKYQEMNKRTYNIIPGSILTFFNLI